MSKEIRENHQSLYVKRKKFERSTPVFQYPLPWQPGWRNLLRGVLCVNTCTLYTCSILYICTPEQFKPVHCTVLYRTGYSGRPLGGNNLARDNRVDWVRTILHQIPYYIPPVIIANIINIGIFAFMMGFIEVFPNLLAMVFGTSKNVSLILNTTAETSETSGDLLPEDAGESEELSGLETEAGAEAGGWDVTLAYTVLVSSLVVAGIGQILVHLEQNGESSSSTSPSLCQVPF